MTSGTAKPHTKVSKASGDGSGNDDLFVARLCAALSNAATLNNNHEKSVLDEARDNDVTSTCAMSIDSAGRMITQVVSQAIIAAADAPTPTSFAQLPGEVRNRIYRAYFDIFAEEKREQIIFRTTASKYLNLLHVDRMIRSEAGSIFDTEYLCIDNFATIGVFQDPLLCRIRSISALLNIRKAGPKFSVTCTRISGPSHGFCEDLCRRVHDRRRFVQLLGRIISHWKSVESEYSRSSLHPEHDGERLFLSEKGQLRNKTRSVKEYLIQCDVQRDPWDGMAESVFHISGPLAELNWPKEHWRNLECLLC